jgi:hypothetical protein
LRHEGLRGGRRPLPGDLREARRQRDVALDRVLHSDLRGWSLTASARYPESGSVSPFGREGEGVASEAECEAALRLLVEGLAGLDPDVRSKYVVDRTVSCRVPDLDVTWFAHLTDDGLVDVVREGGKAQVRLTVSSDDLVALVEGKLSVPTAVATGKVRVQASPFDLLRLSAFL